MNRNFNYRFTLLKKSNDHTAKWQNDKNKINVLQFHNGQEEQENSLKASLFRILRLRTSRVLVGFPMYYYCSWYLPKGFTSLEKIKLTVADPLSISHAGRLNHCSVTRFLQWEKNKNEPARLVECFRKTCFQKLIF